MFTQTEVRYLEPCHEGWRIHFTRWQDNGRTVDPIHDCVTAANVVLGAGSLGTTELLLRSRQHGLSLSPRLGCQWSTNGDGLGFLRKAKTCPNAVGVGAYPIDFEPVGPTVETTTFVNEFGPLLERLVIQEGAIPRAAANFFGLLFGNPDLDNTLALLAVGHDTASGVIRLVDNRASVFWPGLQESENRARIQQTIARFADAHGATYRVIRAFGDRLATVHPLGGCAMSDSLDRGVVNHLGQVFAAGNEPGVELDRDGQAVYSGLFVADGSIIPRSLGANPYLTICALSERIAFHMPTNPSLGAYLRPWGSTG
jgi:cholesterol oxidase